MGEDSPAIGSGGCVVGPFIPVMPGPSSRVKANARGVSGEERNVKLAQSEGSTISLSFPDSSSDGSSISRRKEVRLGAEVINWEEVRLGQQIQPYRGYAHCADDIRLLSNSLELCQLSDIDGEAVKLLLRTLKFLRLCDYSVEDICSIMAHASAYFIDVYKLCGEHMDRSEVGNVLATLMFVAHSWVQDETCPLHVWHKHLFRKYCPLKTLNAAIMRLLEIREHRLRLDNEDLNQRFTYLQASLRWGPANGSQPSRALGSKEASNDDGGIAFNVYGRLRSKLEYWAT